jgi:hypothetical protein
LQQPAAFALVLQGAEEWPVHKELYGRAKEMGDKLHYSMQVSFFHMPTREFFGSTWQSQRGKEKRDEAVAMDAFQSYSVTMN